MEYAEIINAFPALTDGVDQILAAHPNERADAIRAIVTELGSDGVKGGHANLAARLAAIEQGLADLGAVINPSPSTELWVADFSSDGSPPDPPWEEVSGTWQFVANQLDHTDSGMGTGIIVRDTGQADHRVSARIRIGQDSWDAHVCGLVCAFVDADNYVGWELVLGDAPGGEEVEENKIVLYTRIAGSDAERVSIPADFDFEEEHDLEVRRFGNVVLAWLNGEQIASYTLSSGEIAALSAGTKVGAIQFAGRSSWLSMRATSS